jgi:hypothetical protein
MQLRYSLRQRHRDALLGSLTRVSEFAAGTLDYAYRP